MEGKFHVPGDKLESLYAVYLNASDSGYGGYMVDDTFTVDWSGEVNWWVPPIYLVCRTIAHASNCKGKGILVVPMWRSVPFWPVACPDGENLAQFIHLWWSVNFYPSLFVCGRSGNSLGDTVTAHSQVLVLFINFWVKQRINNYGFQIC